MGGGTFFANNGCIAQSLTSIMQSTAPNTNTTLSPNRFCTTYILVSLERIAMETDTSSVLCVGVGAIQVSRSTTEPRRKSPQSSFICTAPTSTWCCHRSVPFGAAIILRVSRVATRVRVENHSKTGPNHHIYNSMYWISFYCTSRVF